jgi:F-type H+-transporting ATPase subunit alpha
MTDAPATGALARVVAAGIGPVEAALDAYHPRLATAEIGTITRLASGIAEVRGFSDVRDQELIAFDGGLVGFAANLARDQLGVVLLGHGEELKVGDAARRTRRVLDVPVGEALLGRVVDALGRPLDRAGTPAAAERWPVERPAPAIIARAPVEVPLQTGVKAVDAAVPIGRGQRELVVGDRQTGKTAIALDAMLNQTGGDVVCVYCAVGQRGSAVARVIADLRERGALEHTIVVVAAGEEAPGLQFAAPYAATSMAEWFMARGRDVLIVYDDLTRHARAYRELSLLLRRPPGREAYPGDIFYIHSRLLERATHLRADEGGGSLTALPVIETQAQNISAYIPTNLISITDGQIYLSPELFRKGQLPAVDVGKSVSRVGGKAQLAGFRAVAGDLRLAYAQFEELETFARFGTRLDEDTKRRLERGRRVREILKQDEHDLFGVPEQVVVLLATTAGLLDEVPLDAVADAEADLRTLVRERRPELGERIASGREFDDDERASLLDAARDVLAPHRG